MANIRKTFNFRNGVQVDDDNLIVNPNGLVGIGTSVPTELLDVRGTAKIVGLATVIELSAVTATIGVATITNLRAGGNISINSGVITATSGIATFYGDGGGLINIPTSQWIDVDSGFGYTSIYAAGFVGVTTDFPYFPFQVGGTGNLSTFNNGVGIGSEGNILATGIVTANTFFGSFVGNGIGITSLVANNIASGTLDLNRLPIITNDKLPSNISVSGIITAQTNFVGNLIGNISGTATTALNVDASANLNVESVQSNTFVNSSTSSTGISTINTRLYVGGTIGIQTNNPQSDIHVFKSNSDASLQITGETESQIFLGRSLNKTTNIAGLKFGNTIGLYPYSQSNSLDIINYDSGNLNHYLHLGNSSGIGTGNFNWFYGKDVTNPLMSLTYEGNLGVGITNPTNKFEVLGNSSFTNNVFIAGNVDISGNLTVNGDLFLDEAELNVNVIGNLTGNVYSVSGISTFFNIIANGDVSSFRSFIGIGTQPTSQDYSFQVLDTFVVSTSGVGLGTDIILPNVEVSAQDAIAVFRGVGIGTTELRSAVDFGDAGTGVPESRQMIIPRVTTTQRGLLLPQNGAIIYNTSTNQFQGFVSPSWVDLGASSGIGAVIDDTSPQLGGNLSLNGKNITGTGNINVTGSITANQVNISGLSTFVGITTVTGSTLFAKQLNVSGVITAAQFIRSGGTSSQFLKADGSVDSSTYLTSYTETDTLDSVTSRGNTTTNDISVGIITSTGGFTSGIGVTDPVQITVSGNVLTFTVAGVGSTSLTLY